MPGKLGVNKSELGSWDLLAFSKSASLNKSRFFIASVHLSVWMYPRDTSTAPSVENAMQ